MSQADTRSPEPGLSPGEPAVVVDAVNAVVQAEPGIEATAGAVPNTVTVALGFAREEFCGWSALEAHFKGRMRALEPESDPAPLLDLCEAAIQRLPPMGSTGCFEGEDAKPAQAFVDAHLPAAVECVLHKRTEAVHAKRIVEFLRSALGIVVKANIQPGRGGPLVTAALQVLGSNTPPVTWSPCPRQNLGGYLVPCLYRDHGRHQAKTMANGSMAYVWPNGAAQGSTGRAFSQLPDPWRAADASVHLFDLIEAFGQFGGFGAIAALLERPGGPGFESLRDALRIVSVCSRRLSPQALEECVWVAKETVPMLLVNLSEAELKVATPSTLLEVVNLLQDLLLFAGGTVEEPSVRRSLCALRLEVHFRFLKSSSLDKRLDGLRFLRGLAIDLAAASSSAGNQSLSWAARSSSGASTAQLEASFFLEWLTAKGVVDELFGVRCHVEVLKRAGKLLFFLAEAGRITEAHVELMWATALRTHEALERVLHDAIVGLIPVLKPPLRQLIFARLSGLSTFTDHTLDLVYAITVQALRHPVKGSQPSGANSGSADAASSWHLARKGKIAHVPASSDGQVGVAVLWQFLQRGDGDGTRGSATTGHAVRLLAKLLERECVSERDAVIQQCMENLQVSDSTEVSLLVLQNVLASFPIRPRSTWGTGFSSEGDGSISAAIESLDRFQGLLATFLADLEQQRSRLGGAAPPAASLRVRLRFLTFILTNSSLALDKDQVQWLWTCLVDKATDSECEEVAFSWFQEACAATLAALASPLLASEKVTTDTVTERTGTMVAFSSTDVLLFIFKLLQSIPPVRMSKTAVSLYSELFHFVNNKSLKAPGPGERGEFVRHSVEIQGDRPLWEVYLKTPDAESMKICSELLIDLTQCLSSKMERRKETIIGPFFQTCLDRISFCVPFLHLDGTSPGDLQIDERAVATGSEGRQKFTDAGQYLSRCMVLLEIFLGSFNQKAQRNISIEVLAGRGQNLATTLRLPGSATVGTLRAEIAKHFNESPSWLSLHRPTSTRLSSVLLAPKKAELLSDDDVTLDVAFPSSKVAKIVAQKAATKLKETGSTGHEGEHVIKLQDLTGNRVAGMVPKSLMCVFDEGAEVRWGDLLPPPLPFKRDMVVASSSDPLSGEHVVPTVSLQALRPMHVEQLFSLLDLRLEETASNTKDQPSALDVSGPAWRTLQALPTQTTLLRSVQTLEDGAFGKWRAILDPDSAAKMAIVLNIMDAFLTTRKLQPESVTYKEWAKRFIHLGAVDQLLVVLTALHEHISAAEASPKTIRSSQRDLKVLSVSLVYRILNHLLSGEGGDAVLGVIDVPAVVTAALKSVLVIAKLRTEGTLTAVAHTMQLLVTVSRKAAAARATVRAFPTLDRWLEGMVLRVPNASVRQVIACGLFALCLSELEAAAPSLFSEAAPAPAAKDSLCCVLFTHLSVLVASPDRWGEQSAEMFNLFAGVVSLFTWKVPAHRYLYLRRSGFRIDGDIALPALFDPADLADSLLRQCTARAATETMSREDPVLAGLLRVSAVLVHGSAHTKAHVSALVFPGMPRGPAEFLYSQCLFAPSDVGLSSSVGARAGVKCRVPSTRALAYTLLLELAEGSVPTLAFVLEQMRRPALPPLDPLTLSARKHADAAKPGVAEHEEAGSAGPLRPPPVVSDRMEAIGGIQDRPSHPWVFNPSAMVKTEGAHSGLLNQGSTCYMNAFLQQLFFTADFADQLLSADALGGGEGPHESVLFQLQLLFGKLRSSNKVVDTLPFCRSFTDYDGQPISLSEQKDCNEFATMLFDKLERAGPAVKDLLGRTFGGALAYEVVSEDSGEQLSERAEPFFILAAELKDKSSLEESLGAYFSPRGELLSGDNRYELAEPGGGVTKVDAVRRCAIRSLPPTMVVQLKRFEYDLTTWQKRKLNDFFSFPLSLDMGKYTEKGKGGGGGGGAAQQGMALYALRGVVAHTGTADSGHYYSFVRHRDRAAGGEAWEELNDRNVLPFSEEILGRECFGGGAHGNAYLLFYDRVDQQAADQGKAEKKAEGKAKGNAGDTLEAAAQAGGASEAASTGTGSGLGEALTAVSPSPPPSPSTPPSPPPLSPVPSSGPVRSRSRADSLACLSDQTGASSASLSSGPRYACDPVVQRLLTAEENRLATDRHLFHPEYFAFVTQLLDMADFEAANEEHHGTVEEPLAVVATQVAARFAVEVLSRAVAAPEVVAAVCDQAAGLFEPRQVARAGGGAQLRDRSAAAWLLRALAEPLGRRWLEDMLIVCPLAPARAAFAALLGKAVAALAAGNDAERDAYGAGLPEPAADAAPPRVAEAGPEAGADAGAEAGAAVETMPETMLETPGAPPGDAVGAASPGTSGAPAQGVTDGPSPETAGPRTASSAAALATTSAAASATAAASSHPSAVAGLCGAVLELLACRRQSAKVNGVGAALDLLHRVASLGHHECALLVRLGLPAAAVALHAGIGVSGGAVADAQSFPASLRLLALVVRSGAAAAADAGGGQPGFCALDGASEGALLTIPWLEAAVLRHPAEAADLVCALVLECRAGREKVLYRYLLEQTVDATAGRTTARYKAFLRVLAAVLALRDSLHHKRVETILPRLASRCSRLAERKGPGDADFLFDVAKLTVWLGTHDPGVAASLERTGGPQQWETWRRSLLFQRGAQHPR